MARNLRRKSCNSEDGEWASYQLTIFSPSTACGEQKSTTVDNFINHRGYSVQIQIISSIRRGGRWQDYISSSFLVLKNKICLFLPPPGALLAKSIYPWDKERDIPFLSEAAPDPEPEAVTSHFDQTTQHVSQMMRKWVDSVILVVTVVPWGTIYFVFIISTPLTCTIKTAWKNSVLTWNKFTVNIHRFQKSFEENMFYDLVFFGVRE